MKKFTRSLFLILLFAGLQLEAQQFVILKAGKTTQINGISTSYIAALRKTKKGEDYYRITVSVTNTGNDFQQLFQVASTTYTKTDQNALAYFQFVNATGRGLSATTGKLYAGPLTIDVPYKCKKCPPPTDSHADKYNHYFATYVIGIQFLHGATITHAYDIRVHKGATPIVRAMIK